MATTALNILPALQRALHHLAQSGAHGVQLKHRESPVRQEHGHPALVLAAAAVIVVGVAGSDVDQPEELEAVLGEGWGTVNNSL